VSYTYVRIPNAARAPLLLALMAAVLVSASALYCWVDGPLNGTPPPDASTAWTWAAHVWITWLAAGAMVTWSRGVRSRVAKGTGLVFCVAAVAGTIVGEWALGLAGQAAGIFNDLRSLTDVAYERLPLAMACAALIVLVCKRLLPQPGFAAATGSAKPDTLMVLTAAGKCLVRLSEVERFTANENYVRVHHVSGREYLLRTTMERLAETLDSTQFARVHRSAIVNRARVVERRPGDLLVLASGAVVHVGRTYRARVQR
jgi:hypothetical protein